MVKYSIKGIKGMDVMKTVAIIGAGQRGQDIYGEFIKNNGHLGKVVAVVEPNDFKREKMAIEHNILKENVFDNLDDFSDIELHRIENGWREKIVSEILA